MVVGEEAQFHDDGFVNARLVGLEVRPRARPVAPLAGIKCAMNGEMATCLSLLNISI